MPAVPPPRSVLSATAAAVARYLARQSKIASWAIGVGRGFISRAALCKSQQVTTRKAQQGWQQHGCSPHGVMRHCSGSSPGRGRVRGPHLEPSPPCRPNPPAATRCRSLLCRALVLAFGRAAADGRAAAGDGRCQLQGRMRVMVTSHVKAPATQAQRPEERQCKLDRFGSCFCSWAAV